VRDEDKRIESGESGFESRVESGLKFRGREVGGGTVPVYVAIVSPVIVSPYFVQHSGSLLRHLHLTVRVYLCAENLSTILEL